MLLAEPIEELPVSKPSNIKIKVVDFGIFGSNRGGVMEKSNAGSLKFMSPELLLGRTQSTPKIDIWALGCILHALILGEFPFAEADREKLKTQIINRPIQTESLKNSAASAEVRNLIDKMLTKEPEQRIELIDVLAHPWVTQENLPPSTSQSLYERRGLC